MSLKYVLLLTCRSDGNRTASISVLSVTSAVNWIWCAFFKFGCNHTILLRFSVHVRSWFSISACDFSMKYFTIMSVICTNKLSCYPRMGFTPFRHTVRSLTLNAHNPDALITRITIGRLTPRLTTRLAPHPSAALRPHCAQRRCFIDGTKLTSPRPHRPSDAVALPLIRIGRYTPVRDAIRPSTNAHEDGHQGTVHTQMDKVISRGRAGLSICALATRVLSTRSRSAGGSRIQLTLPGRTRLSRPHTMNETIRYIYCPCGDHRCPPSRGSHSHCTPSVAHIHWGLPHHIASCASARTIQVGPRLPRPHRMCWKDTTSDVIAGGGAPT